MDTNKTFEDWLEEVKKDYNQRWGKKPRELNKWYKRGPEFLFRSTSVDPDSKRGEGIFYHGYGFYQGKWFDTKASLSRHLDDGHHCTIGQVEEATAEEVKEALVSEAKRRGFVKGVKADCSSFGGLNMVRHDRMDFKYYPEQVELSGGHWVIFKSGKWAEIIVEPKEMYVNIFGEDGDDQNDFIPETIFYNKYEALASIGLAESMGKYKHKGTFKLIKIE